MPGCRQADIRHDGCRCTFCCTNHPLEWGGNRQGLRSNFPCASGLPGPGSAFAPWRCCRDRALELSAFHDRVEARAVIGDGQFRNTQASFEYAIVGIANRWSGIRSWIARRRAAGVAGSWWQPWSASRAARRHRRVDVHRLDRSWQAVDVLLRRVKLKAHVSGARWQESQHCICGFEPGKGSDVRGDSGVL